MFKYFKYTPVSDDHTTYIPRGEGINYFDSEVVSCEGELPPQDVKVQVEEIDEATFKELVKDSAQIKRCRDIVAELVAKKYSYADEIALLKKPIDDSDRVAYEAYVEDCKQIGREHKAKLGWL